jgi:MFS family permease
VILSLALMAVGMLMATLSGSVATLAVWRVVAGLGIGACVTVINPLAAEFSLRATGVGFVMGSGRVASAVAPLLAGVLFAAGPGARRSPLASRSPRSWPD